MVIKYASTHNLSEDEKAELYEDFGSGDKLSMNKSQIDAISWAMSHRNVVNEVTTNEESELSECPTTKKKSSLE